MVLPINCEKPSILQFEHVIVHLAILSSLSQLQTSLSPVRNQCMGPCAFIGNHHNETSPCTLCPHTLSSLGRTYPLRTGPAILLAETPASMWSVDLGRGLLCVVAAMATLSVLPFALVGDSNFILKSEYPVSRPFISQPSLKIVMASGLYADLSGGM